MATDTLTTITQPAPLFEKGAEKYLELLTAQTGAAGALKPLGATPTTRAEGFAPGVAQQSALAQATQQQAAKQAGLGTLAFDPTTGAISGLTPGTGIGGYQQYLDPAAAQAQAAGTTLGNVRGQLTGAQTAAGLAQPLLTQAGQDIGTAATTLGGVSIYISSRNWIRSSRNYIRWCITVYISRTSRTRSSWNNFSRNSNSIICSSRINRNRCRNGYRINTILHVSVSNSC